MSVRLRPALSGSQLDRAPYGAYASNALHVINVINPRHTRTASGASTSMSQVILIQYVRTRSDVPSNSPSLYHHLVHLLSPPPLVPSAHRCYSQMESYVRLLLPVD